MIQTPPLTMSDMEALTLQMQTARDLVLQLPECDPRREVKDAIRVMAAVCSVKIVVRKTKVSPKPLDVWKQLNEIVQTVNHTVSRRLPERRSWIFQNSMGMFREGMSAVFRTIRAPKPA